jgi:hypothetical protein
MTVARQRFVIAFCLIGVGLLTAALIALHPEKLHVPAWVALAAVSTFPLAGVVLLLQSCGAKRVAGWLGLLLVAGLLVPGFWIAFAPGPRDCTISIVGISGAGSELACRIGFGIGELLGALVLALLIGRIFQVNSAARR